MEELITLGTLYPTEIQILSNPGEAQICIFNKHLMWPLRNRFKFKWYPGEGI